MASEGLTHLVPVRFPAVLETWGTRWPSREPRNAAQKTSHRGAGAAIQNEGCEAGMVSQRVVGEGRAPSQIVNEKAVVPGLSFAAAFAHVITTGQGVMWTPKVLLPWARNCVGAGLVGSRTSWHSRFRRSS